MNINELMMNYQENNVVVDDLDKIGKPLAVASSLAVELVDYINNTDITELVDNKERITEEATEAIDTINKLVELNEENEDQLVKVSYCDWSIGFTITKLNEEDAQ